MPKKKNESSKRTNVRVGNISDVSGNVNVAAGNITTHQTTDGLNAEEIHQLFLDIYREIDGLNTTPVNKEDIKAEVKEIQTAVTEASQKNEHVEETFISRRFRNIARMAPDMLDVIVALLANPLAGLGVAAKKIAEKAKEEAK